MDSKGQEAKNKISDTAMVVWSCSPLHAAKKRLRCAVHYSLFRRRQVQRCGIYVCTLRVSSCGISCFTLPCIIPAVVASMACRRPNGVASLVGCRRSKYEYVGRFDFPCGKLLFLKHTACSRFLTRVPNLSFNALAVWMSDHHGRELHSDCRLPVRPEAWYSPVGSWALILAHTSVCSSS